MLFEEEEDDTPKLRPTRPHKAVPVTVNKKLIEGVIPEYVPSKPVPIVHIDDYIRDMKLTGEKEQLYRQLYTPPPHQEILKKETFQVPSDPLTVFTTLKVLNSGIVRVKISVPMEPVHLYEKKGKVAPLEVRIRAAKGFGYPDHVLENMIRHHDETKVQSKKLDEFIDSIFGKCTSAKTSKPKVKTVHESLNTKFKKKPAKKYS
jgi:hypothetical protein